MFSLIIAIISIALVAALALATIYYGGDAFNKGSAAAKAAQLINEGQQLSGAIALFKADVADGSETTVTDVGSLVDADYLTQIPAGWETDIVVTSGQGWLENNTVSTVVCQEVNKKAGFGETVLGALTDIEGSAQYGCYSDEEGVNTVVYRF